MCREHTKVLNLTWTHTELSLQFYTSRCHVVLQDYTSELVHCLFISVFETIFFMIYVQDSRWSCLLLPDAAASGSSMWCSRAGLCMRGPGSTAASGVNHEAKLSGSHRFSNSSTEMLFHITHTNTFSIDTVNPCRSWRCVIISIFDVLYSSGQQNVAMYSYLILKIVCISRCSHAYIIVWQYSRLFTYIFHWHIVLYYILYSIHWLTLLQYVWAYCQATLTAACLLNRLSLPDWWPLVLPSVPMVLY